MILYTHNNKLIKIRSGLNAGKLIEKYVADPPLYWTSTEVTGKTYRTFNAVRWNNLKVTIETEISDPSNQYWVNLPVRLIKD